MLNHHYFSNAKINLGLQVLNKRKDGFHNIQSLFLEIDLADELIFIPSSNYSLKIENTTNKRIPTDDSNLITKAYNYLKKEIKSISTDYTIYLKKQIPIGAGLGGGSSNAAQTLKALNKLWNINLNTKELEKISKKLGSDVSFFIKGGFQLVQGKGEKLTLINNSKIKDLKIIVIIPNIYISTPWAYSILNKSLEPNNSRPKFSPLSTSMNWELFENDFERVIHETYPEIRDIKANLIKTEALYAGLSGSGSTVFGVFDNLQKAESILDEFNQYQTFLCSPVLH